jgi:hypothetical protein
MLCVVSLYLAGYIRCGITVLWYGETGAQPYAVVSHFALQATAVRQTRLRPKNGFSK